MEICLVLKFFFNKVKQEEQQYRTIKDCEKELNICSKIKRYFTPEEEERITKLTEKIAECKAFFV